MARHKRAPKLTFAEKIKDQFNYDVTGLGTYVDDQSPDIMEDLVFSSGLTARITVMEGVKGSQEIKLKTSDPAVQSAASCAWNASGGIVLTDKAIATVRVKVQEAYCNEDLNDTWAQIENAAGANRQDETPPSFADTMIAYYIKVVKKKNQDLMFNGDTGSVDTDLDHYDGFVLLWEAETSGLNTYFSAQTSITSSNAYDIAIGLYNEIPAVLLDNEEGLEIICGRETYRAIIEQVYADNNYHFTLEEEVGPEPSFILPTTNIRVRAYSQLNATDYMYAVPYRFMFFGTDLENDMDGFEFKYSEYDEQLRFSVKWRSGVQWVLEDMFTKLRLTPTS